MRRLFKITVFLLVLLSLGLFFVVENVLPYSSIKPWRLKPSENPWRFPNGYRPENFGLQGETIRCTVSDSVPLVAYYSKTYEKESKGTIIILHGIASCKETQYAKAANLAANGWNSLVVDLRAHGESGGEYCTFGHYEKHDLKTALDSLLLKKPELAPKPIGIWGASLGGAIALQCMAIDSRYDMGIIESTFDEFVNVAEEYGADMMLGLRSRPLTERVLRKSGAIAHFDPFSVKPVEAAATIQVPTLFIHGEADEKIPISFNRRNYEAVPNPHKRWIAVPGAKHRDVWGAAGETLHHQVMDFLNTITTSL